MPNQLLTIVLNRLINFRSVIETKSDYKKELADLNQLIENISAPLNIMIMGEFSTGKSTFINALLGKKVVKMADTPTTAVITKLCFGTRDTIIVYFKDGRSREYTSEEFNNLTATENGDTNTIHAEIDYVERKLPIAKLKKATIIDSPGLNAIRREDEKITRQFIENADTILLLYDINKMNSKFENDLLDSLNERLQPIGIVNKIDDFDEEEEEQSLEEFLDEQKQVIGAKVSKLIGVSAKQALDGQLSYNQALINESNIRNVEKIIDTLLLNKQDRYKFYFLLDKIGEVCSEFGNAANQIAEKIQKISDEDYGTYIRKQADILDVMDELSKIAQPIYEFIHDQTHNASSKMFLGILYYYGILLDKNTDIALKYLEASAIRNNEIAQLILADRFLANKNYAKYFYWAKKLTQTNNPKGQYLLYICYKNGYGIEKNDQEALKWLKKAAEQNYYQAVIKLSKYPEIKQPIKSNFTTTDIKQNEVKESFTRSQEKNKQVNTNINQAPNSHLKRAKEACKNGQYYLSMNSYTSAIYWFEQAANFDSSEAKYYLFICYSNGYGVKTNYEKAINWLNKAAEQNFAKAQYTLGMCYLKGHYFLPKNEYTAFKWISTAAYQNNVKAEYELAKCYLNGIGVTRDTNQAIYWLRKASSSGHEQATSLLNNIQKPIYKNKAKAKYELGLSYEKGTGGTKNLLQAFNLYNQSAAEGYGLAQYKLAMCYLKGIGTSKNVATAFFYFTKAAQQNIPAAQYELANCHANGIGTIVDNKQAIYWFEKAANAGHEDAKTILNHFKAQSNSKYICQNCGNKVNPNDNFCTNCGTRLR